MQSNECEAIEGDAADTRVEPALQAYLDKFTDGAVAINSW